jgi:ATP-binding cassette subfamily B protein/ATP-binding cassette subfamily C protein
MPLLTVILPKYIIEELMGQKRIDILIMLIGILIGYNLIGSMFATFLRGRCSISKSRVFKSFQSFIAENLAVCDFEQLENPEFLDIKEKAHKFLYANGQGFGVVLDSAINILGKIFIFIGLIAVLSTLNILIVLIFIGLVLLNSLVETKIRSNWVKWDIEKAPI